MPVTEEKDAVERITGFWYQYSKQILIALAAIIIVGGGIFGYTYFISGPNEKKASEAMRYAEEYFRQDSVKMAFLHIAIVAIAVSISVPYWEHLGLIK